METKSIHYDQKKKKIEKNQRRISPTREKQTSWKLNTEFEFSVLTTVYMKNTYNVGLEVSYVLYL